MSSSEKIVELPVRAKPVVGSVISAECAACIEEDRGAPDLIGRPTISIIIRRILEAHYAQRIAKKKAALTSPKKGRAA